MPIVKYRPTRKQNANYSNIPSLQVADAPCTTGAECNVRMEHHRGDIQQHSSAGTRTNNRNREMGHDPWSTRKPTACWSNTIIKNDNNGTLSDVNPNQLNLSATRTNGKGEGGGVDNGFDNRRLVDRGHVDFVDDDRDVGTGTQITGTL